MFRLERNEQLGLTVLKEKDFNRALTFDLCLECKDSRFQTLLNQFLPDFNKSSTKNRIHSTKDKKTLEQILLNLIRCYQMDPDCFLIFAQGNEHYITDRYNPLKITRQKSIDLKEWLADRKYLKGINGRWSKVTTGMISRVRPTIKLKTIFISHKVEQFKITSHPLNEVIFLKDIKKSKHTPAKYINYKRSSPEANNSRRVIKKYNELMDKSVITYNGKQLPVSYFHIHRVFNNKDWQQGGRYYGGFQQMSKNPKKVKKKGVKDRRKLKINNNSVIEYDYSRIHPSMLYDKIGMPLNKDPYVPKGYKKKYRNFIKAVFNIMINCLNKKQVHGAATKEAEDDDYSKLNIDSAFITKLISDLELTHTNIKQFFYSGEGLKLQYLDSLVATKVIENFVSQSRAIIPYHDSFIVEAMHGADLKQVMQDSFQEVMRFKIGIKP